jgi:branched-chain amino acid transport system ATP-binding protein
VKNLLEIKKIYHYYEKAKALEEINLKVEEGSLDAVIGPNGAGKTTLLKVISGLEEPDRGKIEFLGERIDGLKAHKIAKKGIALCPERRRLFPDMTVRLKERLKQRAGTLSGGEQQMLAIARALIANPKLLLLDEPSLGLAPKIKNTIFKAINQIKDEGTTILLIEQDAVLAMDVAENIYVLEDGKIEMRGTAEQLKKEPRIKKAYLGI